MKKILLLETLAETAIKTLEDAADIGLETAFDLDLSKLNKNNLNAVITRGKAQVTCEVIDQLPNLEIIARAGVGLNNVDVDYATSRGIKVLNNPGANAQTVAEHTLALLLMLQRNLFNAVAEIKAGNWGFRNEYCGDEISGKTLGILGMGNIGRKVAEIAKVFGMKVIYSGRKKEEVTAQHRKFEELLRESDVISLHIPLNPETQNLLNAEALKKMKRTALIINTARGGLVDEQALALALQNRELAGYAADVMAQQPPKENDALLALPNVLITPHMASLTVTTYTKMCVDAANNVLALLRNEKPMDGCIFNEKQLDSTLEMK